MPPVKMRGDGRMAKSPKKTMMRLLGYLKKYTPVLLIVLVQIFQSIGTALAKKLDKRLK